MASTDCLAHCNRADGKFKFIQVRHEEMAAFMASAYAKFTGELGVCLATSGPGASHLITGLYDARLDHMPVLAITGQQARTAIGGHYQQEVDLPALFKDVAGAFVARQARPPQVRHLVDRAMRIAMGNRRVTALVFPNDLQDASYEEPPRKHGTVHSGIGYSAPTVVPQQQDLRRAAEVLNAGKKVAILVGAGALHATDEVIAVAEKLGAGVAKALLGKAALPDDLPWVTGLHRPARHQAELGADEQLRHVADDRLRASPIRNSCPRKARRAACRSTSSRTCSACAIRWR